MPNGLTDDWMGQSGNRNGWCDPPYKLIFKSTVTRVNQLRVSIW